MKICLVRLPSSFLIDEMVFPPLGLMAVGTALKEKGHEVRIYDGLLQDLPMNYEGYGVGPTIPEYPYALQVKTMVKNYNPSAKVVIGGSFATLKPEQSRADGFDCVVSGDGEMVAEKAFTDGVSMLVAEECPLDEYPIIDRTLVDIKNYKYYLDGRLATSMITSQGCPFRCGFCSKNYKTVRFRSPEKVVDEIENLHFSLGYNAIVFVDDIFVLDKKRAEYIFVFLKEWKIKWRCLIRADIAVRHGERFVDMMADSGCVEVGMGIESGSDRILSNINKGETVETIKEGIRLLKEKGIRVKGFFILGLPGETHESMNETDSFMNEMCLDDVDVRIYQPYPESPIWNNRDAYDIQWSDLDLNKMFYKGRPKEYYGNIRTSALTNAELVSKQQYLEERYKKA